MTALKNVLLGKIGAICWTIRSSFVQGTKSMRRLLDLCWVQDRHQQRLSLEARASQSPDAAAANKSRTHTQANRRLIDWVVVLRPARLKIGHFGDLSPSQSLGLVWKKLNLTKQKHAFINQKKCTTTQTHTHLFNGPLSGTTRVSRYQKGKPIWILLKQETASGSGISWAICKSVPRSRQIATPAPHHFVFYRLDALPAAQPTGSKHWRQQHKINTKILKPGSIAFYDTLLGNGASLFSKEKKSNGGDK